MSLLTNQGKPERREVKETYRDNLDVHVQVTVNTPTKANAGGGCEIYYLFLQLARSIS